MTRNSVGTAAELDALLRYHVNRRRFLSLIGGAGVLGAGCASGSQRGGGSSSPLAVNQDAVSEGVDGSLPVLSSTVEPERRRPANPDRRLVVIEMAGGNDGLAMLTPYDNGVLRDGRDRLLTADDELVDAGGGFGWHPNLAGLAELGMAAAVGVGSSDPSFSHFEMEQRWWRGVSEDSSQIGTGFFGRLCDELDNEDPVTGLSFGSGPTPALASEKAVTVGLADPGASWFFTQDEPWFKMLRSTFGAMSQPSSEDSARFAAARENLGNTVEFAEALSEIPESDESVYPWTDIGQQLRFAAEVMDLDVGVRVIHVRQDGFDTHAGQHSRHGGLMTEFNDATVAFITDLDERGRLDDTLIVTTSEFGRRVPENDGGTDHGGASTMAVCGLGRSGVHGVAPDLTKLDDGNVIATARFEDYYATIAEDWFEVGADLVLPTGGTPITGLI